MTMPQWMIGLFVGVVLAWAAQALQTFFKRLQYRDEKILDAYADFVGFLSNDLERAKSVDAMIALSGADVKEAVMAEFRKLEEKRHEMRRDLLRLTFQIRMLEKDNNLRIMVEAMAKNQPFMAFPMPAQYGKGNYDERYDGFKKDIASFYANLEKLVDAVHEKHKGFLGLG